MNLTKIIIIIIYYIQILIHDKAGKAWEKSTYETGRQSEPQELHNSKYYKMYETTA